MSDKATAKSSYLLFPVERVTLRTVIGFWCILLLLLKDRTYMSISCRCRTGIFTPHRQPYSGDSLQPCEVWCPKRPPLRSRLVVQKETFAIILSPQRKPCQRCLSCPQSLSACKITVRRGYHIRYAMTNPSCCRAIRGICRVVFAVRYRVTAAIWTPHDFRWSVVAVY